MSRVIDAFAQFFDSAGDPLENGWLEFLVSETTSTKKDTFADKEMTIPNTNPIQLDAAGYCPNVFGIGSYKVKLYENNPITKAPGSMLQEFDPVVADYSPAGSGDNFLEWDYDTIYQTGNIVVYGPYYYKAVLSANQGNIPSSTSAYWEQINFIRTWNPNVTYALDDIVQYNDALYFSLAASNVGNIPLTSPVWWNPVGSGTILLNWEENGTTFRPSVTGYDVGDSTHLLGDIYLDDASRLLLGASQDLRIQHDGSDTIIANYTGDINILNAVAGAINFHTDNTARWAISSTGMLIPATANAYSIGSTTYPIDNLYFGDSGTIYLGTGQDGEIFFDGTELYFKSVAGDVVLNAFVANNVIFKTNNITRWYVEANTGHILPGADDTYILGGASNHIKSIYVGTGKIYIGSDEELYLSSVSTTLASILSNGQAIEIGAVSAHALNFKTDNTDRWSILSTGGLMPVASNTYDIGSASYLVKSVNVGDTGVIVGDGQDLNIIVGATLAYVVLGASTGIPLQIGSNDDYYCGVRVNNAARWLFSASGGGYAFMPNAANSYDIGGSSNEIKTIYTGQIYLGTTQHCLLDNDGSTTTISSIGDPLVIETTGGAFDMLFKTNGTERARIDDSDPGFELEATVRFQNAWAYNNSRTGRIMEIDSTGLVGYDTSSKRAKKEISYDRSLTEKGLDTSFIFDLKLAKYKYKEEIGGDGRYRYGFIAEDVVTVCPELVFYDIIDGEQIPAGIYHLDFGPLIINEVQLLRERVTTLEKELEKVKVK